MAATGRSRPRSRSRSPKLYTLRSLLEDRANDVFLADGVADVPVDGYEIDLRLSAMHKALVAHAALNRSLSHVGATDMPDKLVDSIAQAESLGLIEAREVRWLKFINQQANEAKHGRALPF